MSCPVLCNSCYTKTSPPHSVLTVLVCLQELNGSPGKIQQDYLCLLFTQSNAVPLFYFVIANWRYFPNSLWLQLCYCNSPEVIGQHKPTPDLKLVSSLLPMWFKVGRKGLSCFRNCGVWGTKDTGVLKQDLVPGPWRPTSINSQEDIL